MILKQLLPLNYRKDFIEKKESGQIVKTHCIYRMGFGKTFHMHYTIK